MAYYIPETWSKIGKLFNYPFIYGRGLDARPGNMGSGAMEINTVPCFEGKDAQGVVYSKIPQLQFPVDEQGRTLLVQDVTYYSKAALYDAFKVWRDGGPACSGRFDEKGAWESTLTTRTTRYNQAGKEIIGVERVLDTNVFEGNVWGLEWYDRSLGGKVGVSEGKGDSEMGTKGFFPQYVTPCLSIRPSVKFIPGNDGTIIPAASSKCMAVAQSLWWPLMKAMTSEGQERAARAWLGGLPNVVPSAVYSRAPLRSILRCICFHSLNC